MLSTPFLLLLLLSLTFTPTSALTPGTTLHDCAFHSLGSICAPQNDSPSSPLGDHINLNLLATGIHNSTGISVRLRSLSTGFTSSPLTWFVRDPDGTLDGTGNTYAIVTSHNGGIFYGDVGPAFAGEGQLPCELFEDNPGGRGEFEWLVTHYWDVEEGYAGAGYGNGTARKCVYDEPQNCRAGLVDVPAVEEPRYIYLADNAEVCGR